MGIPAFFSWLVQKYGRVARKRAPEEPVDCLYVDFNGALHQGAQRAGGGYGTDESESIERAIAYLEHLLTFVQPRRLIFVAVDGVAPRAKLNQQRARRHASARSRMADIEDDFAGLFEDAEDGDHQQEQETRRELSGVRDQLNLGIFAGHDVAGAAEVPEPAPPAAVAAGEEAAAAEEEAAGGAEAAPREGDAPAEPVGWDSNAITPGTTFMDAVAARLQKWAADRTEALGVPILISDAREPGEGEQKIFDLVRRERRAYAEATESDGAGWPEDAVYQPGLCHVIVSADADVLLLSLALHEPRTWVMREQRDTDPLQFEYASITALREYLSEETLGKVLKYDSLQPTPSTLPPPDFERVIDDVVALATLLGNDFVPHLPSAYVGMRSMDIILDLYARTLSNMRTRLEAGAVSSSAEQETPPATPPTPPCEPAADAALHLVTEGCQLEPAAWLEFMRLFALTEDAIFRQEQVYDKKLSEDDAVAPYGAAVDDAWRAAYYSSIADISPAGPAALRGPEQIESMARAWLDAAAWVLAYYTREGCLSWSWSYPFHHAPFAHDICTALRDLATGEVERRVGAAPQPLPPFEQLCAVLPRSSFHLLPPDYATVWQRLPEGYPVDWCVDLTGCRAEYHGVVLLPFLDVAAMKHLAAGVHEGLSAGDSRRNELSGYSYLAAPPGRPAEGLLQGRTSPAPDGRGVLLEVPLLGGVDVPLAPRTVPLGGAAHPPVSVVDRPQYIPWAVAGSSEAPRPPRGPLRRWTSPHFRGGGGKGRGGPARRGRSPQRPTPDVSSDERRPAGSDREAGQSPCDARGPLRPTADAPQTLSYLEHTLVKFHSFALVAAVTGAAALSLAVTRVGGSGSAAAGWCWLFDILLVQLLAAALGFFVYPFAFSEQGRAGPPGERRRPRAPREVSALEHFKPKRCRADWVCHKCLGRNFERNRNCFRCTHSRSELSDPPFYMPKVRWSVSVYQVDHRQHCSSAPSGR